MVKRLLVSLALAAAAVSFFTTAGSPQRAFAGVSATPPPPPPVLPTLGPPPAPTPAGPPAPTSNPPNLSVPLGAKPTASPAPPKDRDVNRVGISGVWEVQIQRPAATTYVHFKLVQNGSTLGGVYLDGDNKQYPLAGSIDVATKAVRIIVAFRDGSTMAFEGTVDNATDMIGDMTSRKDSAVAFTAAYRPKYEFIDNINASPGGLGP